jgi:hypothetical protein
MNYIAKALRLCVHGLSRSYIDLQTSNSAVVFLGDNRERTVEVYGRMALSCPLVQS